MSRMISNSVYRRVFQSADGQRFLAEQAAKHGRPLTLERRAMKQEYFRQRAKRTRKRQPLDLEAFDLFPTR